MKAGKPYPPARVEDVRILPGVAEALAALHDAGFALVVVTNQPDVARGTQSRAAVDAIHARLRAALPLDAVYACFHDDHEHCACRKPAPRHAARRRGRPRPRPRAQLRLVGDCWRDVDAGIAAGCRTVFVDYGYAERRPDAFDAKVASLAEAAAWILDRPA